LLDHPAVIGLDRGIDQIAAQRPEPRQRAILIRPGESAIADDIGRQDGGKLVDQSRGDHRPFFAFGVGRFSKSAASTPRTRASLSTTSMPAA
jgi:hypothetical protein